MKYISGRSDKPVSLIFDYPNVIFQDAASLWGGKVGETTETLKHHFGKEAGVATIGPAGENRVRYASIVTEYSHQAYRMGVGAVMGSKNLKAMVLVPHDTPKIDDSAKLDRISNKYAAMVETNELSKWQKNNPGFSDWIYLHGLDAALCVNNYSKSQINNTSAYKTEQFLDHQIHQSPCPGCPNDCIKQIIPKGSATINERSCGIHQEISGTMGPNLGISDLDFIFRANVYCNENGLDPTSLGFTLSFAAELFEQNLLSKSDNKGKSVCFGDSTGLFEMMDDIVYRRGLGKVLAEGTKRASAQLGSGSSYYAMQVKGLEMVCFEPRSQTNLALGYAVAPIGPRYDICEHDWDFDTEVGWEHSLHLSRTLGILKRIPMNHLGIQKVAYFKSLFNLWSAADALDMCIFAIAPTRILSLEDMAQCIHAVTGWETSSYEIMKIGARRNHLMRYYNNREGLSIKDDCLPDRFYVEPIKSGPRQGDKLDKAIFHEMIQSFYRMMGWDDRGNPLVETLLDHQLIDVP